MSIFFRLIRVIASVLVLLSMCLSFVNKAVAGSLEDYNRISDDKAWLQKIGKGQRSNSDAHMVTIGRFIAKDRLLSKWVPRVDCNNTVCGLLFTNVETEEEALMVVEKMKSASLPGVMASSRVGQQTNKLFKARILYVNDAASEELRAFITN